MNMMTLLSVNVGSARPMAEAKVNGATGIYKVPVAGDVMVNTLGLDGDAVCDTENHGGAGQAVYVYGTADYDWWSAKLGAPLEPGMFGENLTVAGLASADYNIGDRLRIGDVLLEISAPRIPCHVLAKRMDDAHFVKRFPGGRAPGPVLPGDHAGSGARRDAGGHSSAERPGPGRDRDVP